MLDSRTGPRPSRPAAAWALVLVLGFMAGGATAQTVLPDQRSRAEQVASQGVPIADLAPNAPEQYTVKRGDTLWSISRLFLKSPWRWPELWGMNLQDIRNPHRIYPGQVLYLEKKNGRASLRTTPGIGDGTPAAATVAAPAPAPAPIPTVRLSPRTRSTALPDLAVPALPAHLIEPFLAEPLVVDEQTILQAPRIVAAQEGRVMLSRGDRAYARGDFDLPPPEAGRKAPVFRVFRNATPLKDPHTGEVLAFEAHYVGRAEWVRPESTSEQPGPGGKLQFQAVPATIDVLSNKEEIRVGDRLLPEPARDFREYLPHAPKAPVQASVVSIYGQSVQMAGQNQVILINRGTDDGIESGHVLALMKAGAQVVDRTDPGRPMLRLPDERNGLVMVFRPFERVSYALVLEITDGVRVGDRLINPR